jgi:hypothetical protein
MSSASLLTTHNPWLPLFDDSLMPRVNPRRYQLRAPFDKQMNNGTLISRISDHQNQSVTMPLEMGIFETRSLS